ncbi:MAG: ATP-grasp domain-containing protein [Clostridia bacterium]|nr:ATP-grasp domain-containing protein [Clostridia bacterium]
MWTNKKILIIDGYARQTLPMAKAFRKLGCKVTTLCFSKLDVGYATKYANKKILFGVEKENYDAQLAKVKEILKAEKYDMVVPMTDYSATYLSKNKEELSQYAYIAVNNWDVFKLAINKEETMKLCEENGLSAPKTLFSSSPLEDIQNSALRYPLVIKPKTACGSIGFSIIKDFEHLKKVVASYPEENGEYFIQEYIPQGDMSQYGAEVFRNRDGKYSSVLINEKPRWYPIDGGSPTINIVINNEAMEELSKNLLDKMNWEGYANIDFVIDERDGQPKILEVNARISAAVMLNYMAGVNVAKLLLENAFCDNVSVYNDFKKGVSISCCLTEFLWFVKSKKRFKSKPNILFKRRNKDVIFSFADPKPFFVFCIQSMKNYKTAMKKRKRL